MKRYLVFPLCIIIMALTIHFRETKKKPQETKPATNNSKPTTNKNKQTFITSKEYIIKIANHKIVQKDDEVSFVIDVKTNFPPETYLQSQFHYTSSLGNAELSNIPYNIKKASIVYGPFNAKKFLPGNLKVTVFYSPSAHSSLKNVPFTESSYAFKYGEQAKYRQIYTQRLQLADELLSNIKKLYDISRKKYQSFREKNANIGQWHIWKDKWQKSFEFTQNQEREYYNSGYNVMIFPSMRKTIGLLNVLEDLVTVDYVEAIEKNKDVSIYRMNRFEYLYRQIRRNFTYEIIALASDPNLVLVNEYEKFTQVCSQELSLSSTKSSSTVSQESFLFHLLDIQKKYTILQDIQKQHFAKHSNQLLVDLKENFFNGLDTFHGEIRSKFILSHLAFIEEWYNLAINYKLCTKMPNALQETSPAKLQDFCDVNIEKLQNIPQESMQKVFGDLQVQLQNIHKVISEQGNLLQEINNIIIWQSELAKRQEKNQKLLKVDNGKTMQKLTRKYATIAMEFLIFMEDAKREEQQDVLLQMVDKLRKKLK